MRRPKVELSRVPLNETVDERVDGLMASALESQDRLVRVKAKEAIIDAVRSLSFHDWVARRASIVGDACVKRCILSLGEKQTEGLPATEFATDTVRGYERVRDILCGWSPRRTLNAMGIVGAAVRAVPQSVWGPFAAWHGSGDTDDWVPNHKSFYLSYQCRDTRTHTRVEGKRAPGELDLQTLLDALAKRDLVDRVRYLADEAALTDERASKIISAPEVWLARGHIAEWMDARPLRGKGGYR